MSDQTKIIKKKRYAEILEARKCRDKKTKIINAAYEAEKREIVNRYGKLLSHLGEEANG